MSKYFLNFVFQSTLQMYRSRMFFRESVLQTLVVLLGLCLMSLASCNDSHEEETQKGICTLLMYLPYSTDLQDILQTNMNDLLAGVEEMGGMGETRVLAFYASSSSKAVLYEMKEEKNKLFWQEQKTYIDLPYTTVEGLQQVFEEVTRRAPALHYSLIIGGHGMGWIPKQYVNSKSKGWRTDTTDIRMHWDYQDGEWHSRMFGGLTASVQTDVTTLRDAMKNAGFHTDYILFDACYMGNVETAYELKDVTDFLVASSMEISSMGVPYRQAAPYLLGSPDYEKICQTYLSHYSTFYAMMSVVECKQLDFLAQIIGEVLQSCPWQESMRKKIQTMDGYSPSIFFDLGDYVAQLGPDEFMKARFDLAMQLAVPVKVSTPRGWSAMTGPFDVHAYSGLTTSAPSISPYVSAYQETSWAQRLLYRK